MSACICRIELVKDCMSVLRFSMQSPSFCSVPQISCDSSSDMSLSSPSSVCTACTLASTCANAEDSTIFFSTVLVAVLTVAETSICGMGIGDVAAAVCSGPA